MSGGGGGVGGATGTLGGLVALFFVLVAYLSLYLVQEGLGDDLGVETSSATRIVPPPKRA